MAQDNAHTEDKSLKSGRVEAKKGGASKTFGQQAVKYPPSWRFRIMPAPVTRAFNADHTKKRDPYFALLTVTEMREGEEVATQKTRSFDQLNPMVENFMEKVKNGEAEFDGKMQMLKDARDALARKIASKPAAAAENKAQAQKKNNQTMSAS